MGVLSHLEPQKVFDVFEQLCGIPHGSGNTKQISDFCVEYATKRGCKAVQDKVNNVIIYKDATPGYEEHPTVIIQGHIDMVCEQDKAVSSINMETDGLELGIDGDEIFAKGTTLGGDNGIAVAYALALLDDEHAVHPPLEILLTVDEEVGMIGAENLDGSLLKGRILLNIDSEEEGTFLSSCAGGMRCQSILPIRREDIMGSMVKVQICGLKGGHSGMEIIKQRGNSNVLMARLLNKINSECGLQLLTLEGGLKDNAIPLDTTAVFVTKDAGKALNIAKHVEEQLRKELRATDPDVVVNAEILEEECEKNISCDSKDAETLEICNVLTQDSTDKVIALALCLPNGIQRMSSEMEGLVQTSLNMGILRLEEESCLLSYSVRSSVESEKYALVEKMKCLTSMAGGECQLHGDYPGWEYDKDSKIRQIALDTYKQVFGKEAKIEAIHAGLECGLLSGKLPGLDAISFGPNLKDVHTSKERMSISSATRIYKLLVEMLKNI